MVNSSKIKKRIYEEKKYNLTRNIILTAIVIAIILLIIVMGEYFRITAYVTSSVSLSKTTYAPGEALQGDAIITLNAEDFIPEETTVCLQIYNSSDQFVSQGCHSLSWFIRHSNNPSSYWHGYGRFNDVNANPDWEDEKGYGFKYAYGDNDATGTFTVNINEFNLTAPSVSGDYLLRLNATYNPTDEIVILSDNSSFSVSGTQIITSCTSISSSGTYYLQNDIIDSSETVCITVNADNVIIDCQGHTIDGIRKKPSFAVSGGKNLAIKNCTTTDWAI